MAGQLSPYRFENCAVVALSLGAVEVAEPIAATLHSVLGMFLSEDIQIPGENLTVGSVNQGGGFVLNQQLSEGEAEGYYSEFHSYIDDQKREKFARINRLIAQGGVLDAAALREHVVILVSDGLKTGTALEAAAAFLKPIKIQRLIIATPIASVNAVDRMHILADEIHCLSVTDNYLDTNHYFDITDVPTHEQAVEKINNIILKWR